MVCCGRACRSTTIDQSLPTHIFVITLIINHTFKESYTVTKEVFLSGFSLFTVPWAFQPLCQTVLCLTVLSSHNSFYLYLQITSVIRAVD